MLFSLISILRGYLIFLCVPMLLVSSSVGLVIDSQTVYNYGFEKYDIAISTGIPLDQLNLAGQQMRDYFNNNEEFIIITVEKHGSVVQNLFSNREILHMKDVKGLVKSVQKTQIVSVVLIVMCIMLGFLGRESRHISRSVIWLGRGGVLTIVLTALVGLLSLIGFDRLFIYFHLISFNNDLWILDPSRDYLIAMFPQGFFFDATMLIVVFVVTQGLFLAILPRLLRIFWKI